MTPYNTALLFCRLLSIWCVIRAAEIFGTMASTIYILSIDPNVAAGQLPWRQMLLEIGWPLAIALSACILWLGAPIIARNATRDIEHSTLKAAQYSDRQFFAIGQGLLALFLISQSLSGLVYASFSFSMKTIGEAAEFPEISSTGDSRDVASSLIRLILGLLLLLFARRAMKCEASTPLSTSSQDAA